MKDLQLVAPEVIYYFTDPQRENLTSDHRSLKHPEYLIPRL